jgi:predicted adenylyl cyclase CyaB
MPHHSYEVEIKSLLGSKENAENLKAAMQKADPGMALTSESKQRNHYFVGGDPKKLLEAILPLVSDPNRQEAFRSILEKGTKLSVRTRDDGTVLLIVKASIGDDTSANGVSRIEVEEVFNMPLEALDKILLDAGFEYQAKWSRERQTYVCKGTTVCLDKNAGYGHLAEFERMTDDESEVDSIREGIKSFMNELGVVELPQDRLERMFAFYNEHWPEYYGTDKMFVIE